MENDIVILTKYYIIQACGQGGSTEEQLSYVGETLTKGWKQRLDGKSVSKENFDKFINYRKNKKKNRKCFAKKIKKQQNVNHPYYKVYRKLLKNKHWIDKRENIFIRDGYKCTECGSEKDLRVHHLYYYKEFVDPWVYPDDALITLCHSCHGKWHKNHKCVYKDF